MIMRIVVNGLAIALTAWLVPNIAVLDNRLIGYLLLGATFGLLNAFVRPIIQFLTLSLIFVTYGLVVIIINAIMLYLLAWLLPQFIQVTGLVWALIGGLVVGLLGLFLESLLGLTPPIVDDAVAEPAEG